MRSRTRENIRSWFWQRRTSLVLQKPALSAAAGSSDTFLFKEGQKIEIRTCDCTNVFDDVTPRAPGWSLRPPSQCSPAPPRPLRARRKADLCSSVAAVWYCHQTPTAGLLLGRGAAPPVTSAASVSADTFPIWYRLPGETMPRKRPLIHKLIVKLGARHNPTSQSEWLIPLDLLSFPPLFQHPAAASVQQAPGNYMTLASPFGIFYGCILLFVVVSMVALPVVPCKGLLPGIFFFSFSFFLSFFFFS